MAVSWEKIEWKAWDESCFNCAVKRGWMGTIHSQPFPFICVHRETLEGRQLVCAADKKKIEKLKGEACK